MATLLTFSGDYPSDFEYKIRRSDVHFSVKTDKIDGWREDSLLAAGIDDCVILA